MSCLSKSTRVLSSSSNIKPFRIVSLCPSTTQTLYDLDLSDAVVGRTRYCPKASAAAGAASVAAVVGGTKDPKWDKIKDLNPTHVLFNMEENDYTQLKQAEEICGKENTIVDTPVNIQDSKEMVLNLGKEFGRMEQANEMARCINNALERLSLLKKEKNFTFWYFIWHDGGKHSQCRVVGKDTYIDDMLCAAGGVNQVTKTALDVCSFRNSVRYPLIPQQWFNKDDNTIRDIKNIQADFCLLSTEPFPYKEKHIEFYQGFGEAVKIIDGEKLSWHGSKTAEGLDYLCDFFYGFQQ